MVAVRGQRAVRVLSLERGVSTAERCALVADKPVPSPSAKEVLVRIQVRPVNPADGLSCLGVYPGFVESQESLPATPGLEGMGTVEAVGLQVDAVKPGQRVIPLLALGSLAKGEGSWQEYLLVQQEHLFPVPDGVSDEDAAQLIVNPVTAYGMLKDLAVPKGEFLLQTQAGSTLGRQLIAIAKHTGIRTINIVRRAALVPELKALGADEVVVSADEDVVARVAEVTGGRMAYAAVDSVVGELTRSVAASVRENGTVLVFGGASGPTLSVNLSDLLFRGVTVKGWWLSRFLNGMGHQERQAVLSEVMGLLQSRVIAPYTGEKMDLADFLKALKQQRAEARGGKILLTG